MASAMTPAFADKVTAEAISQFEAKTIPNILAMAPLIEKSAEERTGAITNLAARREQCVQASSIAYDANQYLGLGAGKTCLALVAWMVNADGRTCTMLDVATGNFKQKGSNEGAIARQFAKAKVQAIHDRVYVAAGCGVKPPAYWRAQVVASYHAMAELFLVGADGARADNPALFEAKGDACTSAYNYIGGRDDDTAHGAHSGCDGLQNIVENDLVNGCDDLDRGMNKIVARGADDALASEAPKLLASMGKFSEELDCKGRLLANSSRVAYKGRGGSQVATSAPPASPPAAPVPSRSRQMQIDIDDLLHTAEVTEGEYIENLTFAMKYDTAGDEETACDFYAKSRSAALRESSAYQKIFNMYGPALPETKAAFMSDSAKRAREMASNVYETGTPVCEAVGKKLY